MQIDVGLQTAWELTKNLKDETELQTEKEKMN